MNSYLFDFEKITNASGIESALKDWTVTTLSKRAFEASGRAYNDADVVRLYLCIGKDGHIFIYDLKTGGEFFYHKRPKGRKREIARDSDLDTQTLRRISEVLREQEE